MAEPENEALAGIQDVADVRHALNPPCVHERKVAEQAARIEQLEKENARLVENWNILGEKVKEGLPHIRATYAALGLTIHGERCLGE